VRSGITATGRRRRAIARLILRDPDGYHDRFAGEDGWIARARRFDYAGPAEEGSQFPAEFFSLVGFLDHCARSFPASPSASDWRRIGALLSRRFREGRGMGWFDRDRGAA
jgi:hypothetical protein